jgi:antagonist of KipI
LRVLPGPQFDHFSDVAADRFLNSDYRVSPQSDRTGIRLKGEGIQVRDGLPESIISEGIVAGAVQIPGDGQPIIILNETVSGGYRKIAVVIAADLHLLGQLLPGDRVGFEAVDLREAREALWRVEEKIARLRNALT